MVGADGRVKDVAIQKSLHPDADEAVLKLVKDINLHAGKWQPALKDGKAVDAEMILPISFALNDVLQSAEEFPRITGCEHITDIDERKQCATSRMYKFIAEHLVYPQADKDAGIEGMAIVQFVILREGEMVDIRVVRSPSPTMREEVLRVFNLMAEENRWIPATLDGEAVNLQLTVPVKFKLTDETKEEVAEENKPASLVITPNPSQDKITFAVFEGAHTVMIADASGKQVATQKIDGQATSVEMSVGHLISGRYIVQLIGADKTLSGVFVKQ